jgi:hypothetical protein
MQAEIQQNMRNEDPAKILQRMAENMKSPEPKKVVEYKSGLDMDAINRRKTIYSEWKFDYETAYSKSTMPYLTTFYDVQYDNQYKRIHDFVTTDGDEYQIRCVLDYNNTYPILKLDYSVYSRDENVVMNKGQMFRIMSTAAMSIIQFFGDNAIKDVHLMRELQFYQETNYDSDHRRSNLHMRMISKYLPECEIRYDEKLYTIFIRKPGYETYQHIR